MSERAHIVLSLVVAPAVFIAAAVLYFRTVLRPGVQTIIRDAIEVSIEADRPPAPRCLSCRRSLRDWPCEDPRHADSWGIRGWTWESPFYRELIAPEPSTTYVDDKPLPPEPDPECDRCGWPIVPGERVVFMSLGATPPGDPCLVLIEHGVWHAECPRQRGHLRLVSNG